MAAYTWVGTTSNWSTGSNWTPTAPAGGPTSADTVTINNAAPCTVTANSSCLTIDFTGYTSTFTINSGFTLTVSGTAITLGSGMTFTTGTTGILHSSATAITTTITFAGIVIPNLRLSSTIGTASRNITISGTTPTVNNLSSTSQASNYNVVLSSTLNVTTSINLTTGFIFGSIINLVGNVNVQTTTNSSIASALTIPSGSTLTMGSNITIRSIAFTGTGALVHNNFTVNFVGAPNINTSTVTWWNVSFTTLSGAVIASNLNVGNDFSEGGSDWTSSVGVSINISGSLSFLTRGFNYSNILSSTQINMIGTGTISIETGYYISAGLRVSINTTNPLGYTIGTAARLTFTVNSSFLTLVGNSVCSFFNTTTMTVTSTGLTLDVNRTSTGGSEIIMPNLSGTFTFLTDTKCTSYTGTTNSLTGPGKMLVSGNVSGTSISGTATIEFTGSVAANWSNGTYQNNVTVNKSSGAIVTVGSAITWGLANRTLTMNSAVNFTTNSTTVTLSGTPLTINNSYGNSFRNLNIPAATTLTLGGSTTTPITGTLALSGSATFAGTIGWTCGTLTCSLASSIIILQASVTYTTTTSVTMLGTAAGLIVMRSSAPTTTYAVWTLQNPATQSMTYVSGQGIDSNAGMTIYTFGGNITTALVPLNWYNGASQGTKAFTFVS